VNVTRNARRVKERIVAGQIARELAQHLQFGVIASRQGAHGIERGESVCHQIIASLLRGFSSPGPAFNSIAENKS
jgi:hypothetical protein